MTPQDFIKKVFEYGIVPAPVVYPYGYRVSQHLIVGVDQLASPDTGEVAILPQTAMLFDAAREILGRSIPVTAGYRTHFHELSLERAGYKTAKFVSPHSLGAALDLDARPREGVTEMRANLEIQDAVIRAAKQLGLPRPRLGHKAYGEKFTHIDLLFLLFAPYTNLPHPSTWEELPGDLRAAMDKTWRPGWEW